ncbi:ABC transporter ATP-binding protein [Planctomycetaceae bacterium]|nr:ABC transporter ATP-binding protein [Planctomycetaceae bacterium]
MTDAILEAQSVSRTYHPGTSSEVRALSDVSLAIPAGSYVALAGPSGSGKTTLLSLLGALDRPSTGHVRFSERNLEECSDVELARQRRRMGFVFQNFSLIPRLPVWENITYPQIPRGLSVAKRRQAAGEILGRLGLETKADAPPEELSGGEQQRVAVARALIGNPEVIFADEPTSNLDRRSADELAAIFQDINGSGTTLVVSTHDTALIAAASLVFTLSEGRLVEGGA